LNRFTTDIQAAKPEVLLVEEAGEILESHIITSLAPETKQMVLIGDHQQLRPKVNNYDLTVEKGDGYDLNMSSFERLVKKGYPHQTLTQQHRMRPEISTLVRELTYPELVDAETTKARPNIRGFSDNVIFVNHDRSEEEDRRIKDPREIASSSKKNLYEAEMVLKTVRYLAQQGYGSDDIVVLTPYLGQLKMLQDILARENDPILNDLDASDLSRAGLLCKVAVTSPKKRSVHISTIDK
jgi:superfamily I DNA and/or RNA helicase